MNNTRVIVFIESSISKTFLFECARYQASEGHLVHFISRDRQKHLPPTLQGVRPVNSDECAYREFMKIIFVTAPTIKDFIDYMLSLRSYALLPRVFVVENITSFEEGSSESEFILLCSFLKHTVEFCSRTHNNEACLIISTKFDAEKLNTMNLVLLPHKIWQCDNKEDDENVPVKNYTLRELPSNPLCTDYQELSFSLLNKEDGKYVRLNSMTKLFDDDNCNFNAVIS